MKIAGARALITGASGGIGLAIAEELANAGAAVVLTGRRSGELESIAARTGGRVIVADLAEPGGAASLAAAAGPVDLLVANAGVPASGRLEAYEPGEIDRVLQVNLGAPILLARALVPGMIERGCGHVVLVSSLAGLAATAEASLYAATKFGLRGFGLGLRQDLAGTGVGVSVVMPGFVSGAGMWAETGVALPRGVGTRSPAQVAKAIVAAVEADRAETMVAPPAMVVGARLAGLTPALAAVVTRLAGGSRLAAAVAAAQEQRRSG